MKNKIKLFIRKTEKLILHKILLPLVYRLGTYSDVEEKLVLFADSKNEKLPFSMKKMYEQMECCGYTVENWYVDLEKETIVRKFKYLIKFMKRFSVAKYVFLCDYFLPVSSCEKRKETKVIQLWHAGGMFKKFGYDAEDDIGDNVKLEINKNIDLWTVSSERCIPVYEKACQLFDGKVQSFGISRTDYFFSNEYKNECENKFYTEYPEYKGKKIALWAPTFRGNAYTAKLVGIEEIHELQKRLGDDWVVLIKIHPHLAKKCDIDNCTFETEELYPIIDVLITDYSSVIFDFSLFKKPFYIFAPDYDEYCKGRGFYIDMKSELPCEISKNIDKLSIGIKNDRYDYIKLEEFRNVYMKNCDGNCTERIINYIRKC